ncbi:AsmA-like C-terminal region-containing protein [Flavobacterium paronense]|uniref:AsmA-like C-terminal region-containing protein n=1 Tax=Flavobacterium paronense TaxID=1392775 RepID=A0ABV5GDS3_9FLAO|nr:AsmA-like C-terminal region-containing protein [Flavobacterium paronense]MDN3678094.1 AsmA-like C-terminal region-containing protein [Flavobacterium paronense]
MKKPSKSIFVRILKITGITVVIILFLLFLIPILFPGKIAQEVKSFANDKLNGELNFKEANLSFFNHFPSLTLTLTDFSLKGSAPYKKETLLAANEVSFGINIRTLLFDKKVNIDKIFVSNALINVKVNKKGEANYNVYKSEDTSTKKDSSGSSLRLEKIAIENSHIIYDDKSTKMLIDANGFNYVGNGDLDKAIFDLYTEADIEDFDFSYNGEQYLKNKKVNADLITKINTNSLAFIFEQNNLKINKLPVEFKGKFDFLSNGYDMDFNIKSQDSKLNDFFTALPPHYVTWLDKSKVKGSTDLLLTLKGKYIASKNQKPDLAFNMKIRDGYINYNDAPFPASNIFLNFDTKLPSLDTEKLRVNIDSVFFNVDKDYFKAIVKTVGIAKPQIAARIQSKINLGKMNKAFGLQNMDLRGILNMDIKSNGVYDKKHNKIPVTNGKIALKNGYIKTIYYPNPIKNINLLATILDTEGSTKDLKINITPASFEFEGKPIFVNARLKNFDNINYDIKAKGELDLGKIYKVFSRKGLDLEGYVNADVTFKGSQNDAMKGNYKNLHNSGTLKLRNIKTTSEYLPKPFIIKEGTFVFNQDKMNFNDFVANYGQSDFKMNGYLQNIIDFVLTDKAILKGNFALQSSYINCDEFMSASTNQTAVPDILKENTKPLAPAETGVIVIPSNFDLQFHAVADKLNFQDLTLEKLNGNMLINNGKLMLKNSSFDIVGSNVKMDIVYGSESPNKASFDFKILAKDFDVKRAYKEVKLFREMASAAENAEGIISLDYQVAGKLDGNMQPVFPSLVGGGTLSVKKVKMKGFKMFGAVSRKTGKEAIKNPDLSQVDIKTKIKNNIINIERFKFKVAGFRPRIEGQTSFDGNLNIKMRLGLPPLGIIGIPMKITGTKDNPKVSLGRQSEDLKETEYDEGQIPDANTQPQTTNPKP